MKPTSADLRKLAKTLNEVAVLMDANAEFKVTYRRCVKDDPSLWNALHHYRIIREPLVILVNQYPLGKGNFPNGLGAHVNMSVAEANERGKRSRHIPDRAVRFVEDTSGEQGEPDSES